MTPGDLVTRADGNLCGMIVRKPNDRPADSGEWVVCWMHPQHGPDETLELAEDITVVGHHPAWRDYVAHCRRIGTAPTQEAP